MRPIFYTLCLFLACQVWGQPSASFDIVSTSGSLSNESLSVVFLAGTPLIGEDSNVDHMLQYGLLYQYELEVVLSTETLPASIELNVFPNPVTRTLNVRTNTIPREVVDIQLFDLNGRVLLEREINEFTQEASMDLRHFQEGIYLLKILQADHSNTYKIIKNK